MLIEEVQVHDCRGLENVPDMVLDRGNSRRVTAKIRARTPASVNIRDHATHVAIFPGRNVCDSILGVNRAIGEWGPYRGYVMPINIGNLQPDRALIIHLKSASPLDRPNNSKLLLHQGVLYAFLTWRDIFGASIRENAPGWIVEGDRRVPLKQMPDNALPQVLAALTATENVTV